MKAISPELKIHAWGGLGSQLFAVALLKDLQKKFPQRKMTILLHTGGVTRRIPEVVDLFPEISFRYDDDFSAPSIGSDTRVRNLRTRLSPYLKRFLSQLSLLQTCDDDASFERVRLWTQSIRGHYSYRTINQDFLEILSCRLQVASPGIESVDEVCSVHYRLGDLLYLVNKHPIAPSTILKEIDRLNTISCLAEIEIYSDSPSRALELLNPQGWQKMSALGLDTVSVLARATQTGYFIGTSSKVSFWIVGIRSAVLKKLSSIPTLNRREITGLLNEDFKHVHFYGA